MSGFSADWLALRESIDARARGHALLPDPQSRFPRILDLGAGTGTNLRWLAPQLGSGQQWMLIDHDASLLAQAKRSLGDWAGRSGLRLGETDNRLNITAAAFDCSVSFNAFDLSRSLDELEIPAGSLVTASALLDLVSEHWLTALCARIVASHATVLWALSYDGRIALAPAHPDDDWIVDRINRHQHTDKGFGAALGPDAWRFAGRQLEQAGYEVRTADSSWHCGAAERGLLDVLIEGWGQAAAEIAPADAQRSRAWCRLRLEQSARGELTASVGHQDLLAAPPEEPTAAA